MKSMIALCLVLTATAVAWTANSQPPVQDEKQVVRQQADDLRHALEGAADPARFHREKDWKTTPQPQPGAQAGGPELLSVTQPGLSPREADLDRYHRLKTAGQAIPAALALRVNASMDVMPYDESLRQGGGSPLTAVPIDNTAYGATFTDHGNTAVLSNYLFGVPYTYQVPCPISGDFAANDAWYRLTLLQTTRVTASTCSGAFYYDSRLGIFDSGLNQLSGNDDNCGTYGLQSTVSCCLDPGVYYIVVDGYSTAAGEYDLSVGFAACPPVPPCDALVINPAPSDGSSVYGNTTGAPDVNGDNQGDLVYTFTLPANSNLSFTSCLPGTAIRVRTALYQGTGSPCNGGSTIHDDYGYSACEHLGTTAGWQLANLPQGTYTLLVSGGWGQPEGSVEFQLTASAPVADACPPGAWYTEYEVPCGDTNGGCNDATPGPEDYEDVYDGNWYCGTAWIDGMRDTDWYRLTLSAPGVITYTMHSQTMPMQAAIATYDPVICGYTIISNNYYEAHSTGVTVTECQPAGQYVIFAGPNWNYYPCNASAPYYYSFQVDVEPCVTNPPCERYAEQAGNLNIPGVIYGNTSGAPDVQGISGLDGIGDAGYAFYVYEPGRYRFRTCLPGSSHQLQLSVWAGSPCAGDVRLAQQEYYDPDNCELTLELNGGSYWLNVSGFGSEGSYEVMAERVMPPTAGGPDAAGYTWISSQHAQGQPFNWSDISGVGVNLGLSGDDVSTAVALPFAFPFYDGSYSSVYACSNGWLSFTSGAAYYYNRPIPEAGGLNAYLAPFWDDLYASSNVFYYDDTASGRVIFQWNAINHLYLPGANFTFQAILYADGRVVYQYLEMDPHYTNSATTGIESPSETDGLMIHFDAYGARLTDGTAILISPPGQRPTEGGPDAFGYRWRNSDDLEGPQYQWQDISATGTAVALSDDNISAPISLGIPFAFYGVPKTDIYIGSNGLLGFNPAYLYTYNNGPLPDQYPYGPNDVICPFWDDLYPPAGGAVYYQSQPQLGRFIVQYQGIMAYPGAGDPYTFQVILWSNGEIHFQYLNVAEADVAGATVGVENAAGTSGLMANFNNSGSVLKDGLAMIIAPVTLCEVGGVDMYVDAGSGSAVLVIADDGGLATQYRVFTSSDGYSGFTLLGTYPNGPGADSIGISVPWDGKQFFKVVAICP